MKDVLLKIMLQAFGTKYRIDKERGAESRKKANRALRLYIVWVLLYFVTQ